jgi:hypothetical protein
MYARLHENLGVDRMYASADGPLPATSVLRVASRTGLRSLRVGTLGAGGMRHAMQCRVHELGVRVRTHIAHTLHSARRSGCSARPSCSRSARRRAAACRGCARARRAAARAGSWPAAGARADAVLLVFTLGALREGAMPAVLRAAFAALRPGGVLCFRDHGLYDITQLRRAPRAWS